MAGVHRLEHVERFGSTAFADDDPVGPHAQGVLDQIANRVSTRPFHVGRFAFQRHHMVLMKLQFRRVLDRDDALLHGNEARQDVQHRRLSRPRSTADQDVPVVDDAGPQEHRGRRSERSALDQVIDGKPVCGELADGQARAFNRQRRNDRVDARAICQPGIDQRLALVDAAADLRDDPFDDAFRHLV